MSLAIRHSANVLMEYVYRRVFRSIIETFVVTSL